MNYKISFVVISLIFYLRIHSVSCLKCHVCNTGNKGQEDCMEIPPTMTKYLQECHGPANVTCRIQEQWVDFDVLNQKAEKRTVRQCASTPFDAGRPCYYRAGFGGKTNVCNCLGDGCNEATRTASALILIIGTFLFYKFLI
ncbi:uncharacterized protein LOC129957215 [Argiope bruennichi]|uniref:Protein quiver n=1 Tax=Argiope bruennichi TaxID=94029 RepID=A0A8T0FJ16_ARGBR|nr:uncharacterized protein LOC129957215 [Argiope bruennichi]KAF8789529.1 hypothetical protein HNY73_007461 [Argiope bruennichi]